MRRMDADSRLSRVLVLLGHRCMRNPVFESNNVEEELKKKRIEGLLPRSPIALCCRYILPQERVMLTSGCAGDETDAVIPLSFASRS